MASSVINQPTCVVAKFNAIINIHKYRGLHKRHHFILMAMEVDGALGHYMDRFIKECARFFHNKRLGGHLSLSFCIPCFRQCVNITFQRALTLAIERKITLANDAYSRPPSTTRSHDMHVDNIRRAMGEILPTTRGTGFSPFLVLAGCVSFGLSFLSPL
jgi:hypothetical protein